MSEAKNEIRFRHRGYDGTADKPALLPVLSGELNQWDDEDVETACFLLAQLGFKNARIIPQQGTFTIRTRDGKTYTGTPIERHGKLVEVNTTAGETVMIVRREIVAISRTPAGFTAVKTSPESE